LDIQACPSGRATGYWLKLVKLRPHPGMSAAVVPASTYDLGLVANSLAVGAAVFFFNWCKTVAGRVCTLFRGGGHMCFLRARNAPGIAKFDAECRKRDSR